MTRRLDSAAIEVDGVYLDAWQSYSFDSDLFTPADAFNLTIGVGTSSSRELQKTIDRLLELMEPGKRVKLWVASVGKRALQHVGIIDAAEVQNDGDGGTQFSVRGRDLARHLIGSAADPSLYEANDTLISVARRAVAEWGIEVTADHVAGRDLRQARISGDKLSRLKARARRYGVPPRLMSEKIAASIDKGTIAFDDFAQAAQIDIDGVNVADAGLSSLRIYQLRLRDVRPQSGETVWEYLDRHARRNGLLMSMDPQGRLVFSGLGYNQAPSYRITRRINGDRSVNNVISGGRSDDISDVYSRVVVYGRSKGSDAARSRFKGLAEDDSVLPFTQTLQLHDSSIKSVSDAQKRAEYELARSRQGALALEYTVAGHSANGLIFATDTVAHVEDQVTGINAPYYVTARTFQRSNQAAPTTRLKLVPLYSIALPEVG
jgi:prophage tail gpP-like protein